MHDSVQSSTCKEWILREFLKFWWILRNFVSIKAQQEAWNVTVRSRFSEDRLKVNFVPRRINWKTLQYWQPRWVYTHSAVKWISYTWYRPEGVVNWKPCHQFWSELECSFRSPWRLLTASLRKICRRLMSKNTTLFVPFVMSKSDDIYLTAINNLPTHTVVESGLSE